MGRWSRLVRHVRAASGSVRARARRSVWLAGAALVGSGTRGTGGGDGLCGLRLGPGDGAAGAYGPGLCRFRCRDCGKQYNERSGGLLNHTQYPSDVIALVVLWRLRYRLTLHDLAEMFLHRGIVFSHEAVGSGRRSSRPSWPTNSAGAGTAGAAPVAATGRWMRRT
jgi:hypothetical protein